MTLQGTNLGPAESLVQLWNSFIDLDPRGLTVAYMRSPIPASPSSSRNDVRVAYAQASQEPASEYCQPVLSWNSSVVVCRMPQLVGGAHYLLSVETVTQDATLSATASGVVNASDTVAFLASSAVLSAALPAVAPTDGNITLTLVGRNIGKPLGTMGSQSVWQPAVTVTPVQDGNGTYAGLVGGSKSGEAITAQNNDTAAWFTLPSFEGSVSLYFSAKSAGETLSSNVITLSATPPGLVSIAAASQADDPCSQLVPTARAGDGSPLWNGSSQCIQNASRELGALLVPRALSPSAPCFAATTQSALSFSDRRLSSAVLDVTGSNFGSGSSTIDARFLMNSTLRNGSFATIVTPAALEAGDVPVITLSLAYDMPQGNATLVLDVAFGAVVSSAFGIYPRAECPCGYYAPADGQLCVICPTGAVCPGASVAPLARSGYWKTDPQEWLAARYLTVSASTVPPFVACPVGGSCLAGQRCAEGSSGWMCSQCVDGWTSTSAGCVRCALALSSRLQGFLVLLLTVAAICGVACVAFMWMFQSQAVSHKVGGGEELPLQSLVHFPSPPLARRATRARATCGLRSSATRLASSRRSSRSCSPSSKRLQR